VHQPEKWGASLRENAERPLVEASGMIGVGNGKVNKNEQAFRNTVYKSWDMDQPLFQKRFFVGWHAAFIR
jgi:hypothetical protein